jgi:M-phase inducer tyrosine phosphatase
MAASSPSVAKLERMNNANLASRMGKPTLQGLGAPSASFVKRLRRPVLSALVEPCHQQAQSAYPVLCSAFDDSSPRGSAPVRRAFSALLPPSMHTEPEEDESSFDSQDMSSPAQAYSRRQQAKTIRRCDGTEDFRPITGATAMMEKESPSSKHMSPGLPGFGDNEAHGKILPCHRVTEDGLMRINGQTVCAFTHFFYGRLTFAHY